SSGELWSSPTEQVQKRSQRSGSPSQPSRQSARNRACSALCALACSPALAAPPVGVEAQPEARVPTRRAGSTVRSERAERGTADRQDTTDPPRAIRAFTPSVGLGDDDAATAGLAGEDAGPGL